MSKQLMFDDEARAKVRTGVRQLVDAVKVTLGPTGRTVILDKKFGGPVATKDGVTVSKEIELPDPFENMGAKAVNEVASKTNDVAGDGTTTAVILAGALYDAGLKYVAAGVNPTAIQRGMAKGVEACVRHLQGLSTPVRNKADYAHVATIAANNDAVLGGLIADAMEKVGKEGVITVEEGKGRETALEFAEGLQFDKGYVSPYFITNAETLTAEFEDAWLLFHEKKIANLKEFLSVLEAVAPTGRPLVVVAEEVEGEALAILVVNKLRGGFLSCAVKAPGFGDRRKQMLEDMAVVCGGTCITEDVGIKLENVTKEHLGRAKTVRIEKDRTIIIGGAGTKKEVAARMEQIRNQLKTTTSKYDREKLEERLAKLGGGAALIKVGGNTEAEIKERKFRVDDAVHAVLAARDEGFVPGGGIAYLRSIAALDGVRVEGEEKYGIQALELALQAPLRQLAENAGEEGAVVVAEAREMSKNRGWNAATGEFTDLVAAGIIDPAKVVRLALQNAASISGLLLTSRAMLTDLKDEQPKVAGAVR
ncbi:MAG: chaperonin GroEL [Planctomycetes bacterium]|nr:chaperonin GroEL [Planctomycetota bacterium]